MPSTLLGTDESKKIVGALASVISVGYKIFKGNFLAVFELFGTFTTLKALDLALLKQEILDLDAGERKVLDDAFRAGLKIADPVVLKKLNDAGDVLIQAADVVGQGLSVLSNAKEMIEKFKVIFGF